MAGMDLFYFFLFWGHSSSRNDIAEVVNAVAEKSKLPRLTFQNSFPENLKISIEISQEFIFSLR